MTGNHHEILGIHLNPEQYRAATTTRGATLVIAGAGSGKTRVIIARVVNLIAHHGVDPRSIVALTFTNKAALEMRERLVHILGDNVTMPYVGTFHAYCLQLLRINRGMLDYPDFGILDADDQSALIKSIVKRYGLEKQFPPSQLQSQISALKNAHAVGEIDPVGNKKLEELWHMYEQEKRAAHLFDFDDLLLEVLKLLKKNTVFKTRVQERIRHIVIDEYQDTNKVQHELLRSLGMSDNVVQLDSICAVGDEDQSIYSWRGAHVENMLTFTRDFAPVTKVTIEQNYRSVEPILHGANKLIAHNALRNPKVLRAQRTATGRVLSIAARSEYQEADALVRAIEELRSHKLHSIAILYRTHFQSRVIEEALVRQGIPYRIVGGVEFYARKEIKDLLAYLRLVVNPYDRVSFFRVLNTPLRGLGDKVVEHLMIEWHEHESYTFQQLCAHIARPEQSAFLGARRSESVHNFSALFAGLHAGMKPSEALREILERTDYVLYLKESNEKDEATSRIENVRELITSIEYAQAKEHHSTTTLETFLHEISLLQDKLASNDETQEPRVYLMTLHAAKGLEFDTVLLAGLEDGLFPSSRSLSSSASLEEERRLLYVGMTRARERLLLSRSHVRTTYGQTNRQEVSRFIQEIPDDILAHVDLSEASIHTLDPYIRAWRAGTPLCSPASSTTAATKQAHAPGASHTAYSTVTGAARRAAASLAPTSSAPARPSSGSFRPHQRVRHATFGVGVITAIEERGSDQSITVRFSIGEKKVLSRFLERAT